MLVLACRCLVEIVTLGWDHSGIRPADYTGAEARLTASSQTVALVR